MVNFANNITANHEFAEVPMDRIRRLLRDADSPQAECVVVWFALTWPRLWWSRRGWSRSWAAVGGYAP